MRVESSHSTGTVQEGYRTAYVLEKYGVARTNRHSAPYVFKTSSLPLISKRRGRQ